MAARTFTVSASFLQPAKAASGAVSIAFSATSVTVPGGGGRVPVTMTLTVDPAKLPASNQHRSTQSGSYVEEGLYSVWRNLADECMPTYAVCMFNLVYDGRIELKDGLETLSLPWHVLPLRGSDIAATAQTGATGTTVRVANASPATAGQAEFFDWLGAHAVDDARANQGKPHILAWGAREVQYNAETREVQAGLAQPSPATRRGLQVVYVLDSRVPFMGTGETYTRTTGGDEGFGQYQFSLGIDVDGDGRCGNRMNAPFKFRPQNPGESEIAYAQAEAAARAAVLLDTSRMNVAAEASDAVAMIRGAPVFTAGFDAQPELIPRPYGLVNLQKLTPQLVRGRFLATADMALSSMSDAEAARFAPRLWDTGWPIVKGAHKPYIGGISIDFRSGGRVISFIVPFDESTRWFTNRTGRLQTGAPDELATFISKPGSPSKADSLNPEYSVFADLLNLSKPYAVTTVEGLRLNVGQARLTLCPQILDTVRQEEIVYPSKAFMLGGPRHQVAGTSAAAGTVAVPAAGTVSRAVTTNTTRHPALGLLVRSVNDNREVNLVSLP